MYLLIGIRQQMWFQHDKSPTHIRKEIGSTLIEFMKIDGFDVVTLFLGLRNSRSHTIKIVRLGTQERISLLLKPWTCLLELLKLQQ